jgi:hypothetical protein
MTALFIYWNWIKVHAHRRRLVEKIARRFISNKRAKGLARWIP